MSTYERVNTYKRFSVGDIVTVKKTVIHQYFDYPKQGDNNETLEPGEKAVIARICPKVRINKKGTGEYFFNLTRLSDDSFYYPVFDYHLLVKVK
jgi:hypothetical protein